MFDTWSRRQEEQAVAACSRILIAAHPDDETLWGGATLAAEPGWGVVCLTHRRTPERRKAFHRAMRELGCIGVVLDIPDRQAEDPTAADLRQMSEALTPFLTERTPDRVLTHSPDGETGHRMHMAISQVVTSIIERSRLWYFSFDPDRDLPADDSAVWHRKQRALEAYFGSLAQVPGNDGLHVRLSIHERPVPADDYRRPNELLMSIYGGSTVPAGSITKGVAE